MEENKLQQFDPSKLMDGIKDRIRGEFASLIPEDVWKQMVEKEVQYFFYQKQGEGYSSRRSSTQFERLCNRILEEECSKRFKEYLYQPEFQSTWDNSGNIIASEAVKKMIVENSGQVLANFFGNMMQNALDSSRQYM